jgi:hypothetical protein
MFLAAGSAGDIVTMAPPKDRIGSLADDASHSTSSARVGRKNVRVLGSS